MSFSTDIKLGNVNIPELNAADNKALKDSMKDEIELVLNKIVEYVIKIKQNGDTPTVKSVKDKLDEYYKNRDLRYNQICKHRSLRISATNKNCNDFTLGRTGPRIYKGQVFEDSRIKKIIDALLSNSKAKKFFELKEKVATNTLKIKIPLRRLGIGMNGVRYGYTTYLDEPLWYDLSEPNILTELNLLPRRQAVYPFLPMMPIPLVRSMDGGAPQSNKGLDTKFMDDQMNELSDILTMDKEEMDSVEKEMNKEDTDDENIMDETFGLGRIVNKDKKMVPIKYIDFGMTKKQHAKYHQANGKGVGSINIKVCKLNNETKKFDCKETSKPADKSEIMKLIKSPMMDEDNDSDSEELNIGTHGPNEDFENANKILNFIAKARDVNHALDKIETLLKYLEYYVVPLKTAIKGNNIYNKLKYARD